MKTLKCHQLGGPASCNHEFTANTWKEIQKLSQNHAMDMASENDLSHLEAMNKMKNLMEDKQTMSNWMQEKKDLFDSI